nr:MAG TPA: hypothetical protein [Caudoviricetes sp.]
MSPQGSMLSLVSWLSRHPAAGRVLPRSGTLRRVLWTRPR